ncbi:class I SAM-dependent methyltransferase [Nitratireductor sp. XY-223]|uniref:class I SAM-dependent methyltransferase n=1 Tax=Nitratireductor sp. XY-223 TaxID=2561926 RepID=UPI0010A9F394|nr:class I SAM-dependent methyltransferase [Nitratireductor sp. XY-223]
MSRWPDGYFSKSVVERISEIGHRAYVGGFTDELWYKIGKLQYHFLVGEGLCCEHVFYDVACGSLRLGQYLIPYLGTGRYFGIDLAPELVQAGLDNEFFGRVIAEKKPSFFFNSEFDFQDAPKFDFAMAQSLFTHLTPDDIAKCLTKMQDKAHKASAFYFTFFEGAQTAEQLSQTRSDPNKNWRYEFSQISEIANRTGWRVHLVGDWEHPANQKMVRAEPAR